MYIYILQYNLHRYEKCFIIQSKKHHTHFSNTGSKKLIANCICIGASQRFLPNTTTYIDTRNASLCNKRSIRHFSNMSKKISSKLYMHRS